MPFSEEGYEYSIEPGTEFKTFSMTARSDPQRVYRFGVPICYEDVMPYIGRRFVTDPPTGGKRVDFLLNISNDGWFVHSNELPQHLAICAFRAVENRVGIARAVNTGISGFIDPNGRIHDLVQENGRSHGPGIRGYSVARVGVDSRHSLYSRTGDVLAVLCALLSLVLFIDYLVVRARQRSSES
jgi:apolipoprotein N-acyltransferase